jgi:hypothetical protein
MRAGETEQQMAVRHVAEQEKRIAQQEARKKRAFVKRFTHGADNFD